MCKGLLLARSSISEILFLLFLWSPIKRRAALDVVGEGFGMGQGRLCDSSPSTPASGTSATVDVLRQTKCGHRPHIGFDLISTGDILLG